MKNFIDVTKREYPALEEEIYRAYHKSGFELKFIPKKNFSEKYASCTFKYGSSKTEFADENGKIHKSPLGTAHFLEHKMFDRPGRNIMEEFSNLGADCNAATSYSYTTYYFSCNYNFEENFRLLLDMIKNPEFTEESVEKEKGIIVQEINMYEDDPSYTVSLHAMKEMYEKNPVREDIAGTEETVNKITARELRRVYKAFYAPSNMVITVCGDLDFTRLCEIADEYFCEFTKTEIPEAMFDSEEDHIITSRKTVINKAEVPLPLFFFGYKDGNKEEDINLLELAGDVCREAVFGRGTEFTEKLYNDGLINREFIKYYDVDPAFRYMAFAGESKNPEKVADRIEEEIARIKKDGLPFEQIADIARSSAGELLREYNMPKALGKMAAVLSITDTDPFSLFELCGKLTPEYVTEVFNRVFSGSPVLSIVK